jgi:hypothetical protein
MQTRQTLLAACGWARLAFKLTSWRFERKAGRMSENGGYRHLAAG